MPEPIGTYTKDGITQHAYTRADVVQLKFDGWHEVAQAVTPPAAPPAMKPGQVSTSLDLDASGDAS